MIPNPKPLNFVSKQNQTLRVVCTLRAGLDTDDYGTITLTIRSDPSYPRDRYKLALLPFVEPSEWPEVDSVEGEWMVGETSTVEFEIVGPDLSGANRYVYDVVAEGGVAGRVELVKPSWLSVLPSLKN